MSKPYVMHGWHLSYFSGKTRALLQYKNVPFIDHEVDAFNLMWRIPRKTGATVMPVVVTPEGEWLQDTKDIAEVIEQRFPQGATLPETPRQRIAALLIEAWADEWWIPPAMHYRWIYPENYVLFEHDAGKALLPYFPSFAQKRIAGYVAKTLRGYLAGVGIVPAQYEIQERWTENMLDVLDRHFAVLPFLLGSKPSVADFGLFGPMYGHLSRDPWPKRELIAKRPNLKAWVERMNTVKAGSGEFLPGDAIPETLKPVFDAIFGEFYPMLTGIRDEVQKFLPTMKPGRSRLPRALGEIEFPMGQGRYRRMAMPYTLWMVQRILERYQAMSLAEREAVDDWVAAFGAPEAMRFPLGVRLRRVGLHVSVDA